MAMFSPEMFGLGALGALVGAMLVFAIVMGIALYVYTAFAMSTIARKLKYKNPWLAWIPVANLALLPILAGYAWPWVFMFLVPIANIVFAIMWLWKIFEKRHYPGPLALLPLAGVIPIIGWLAGIANLVVLGLVAWVDRKR
ncbi:hypothetical protein HZB90_04130 [archaeon]|nr:hypothetical protein [archaeon]